MQFGDLFGVHSAKKRNETPFQHRK